MTDVPAEGARPNRRSDASAAYDNRFGESDLYEAELQPTGRSYTLAVLVSLALVGCGILLLLTSRAFNSPEPTLPASPTLTLPVLLPISSTLETTLILLATNTPRPSPSFVTVTPAPPTATPLPPPTPCTRIVQPGDTLYAIAINCGYTDPSIIDAIVEANGLPSRDALVLGQEIVVPPPTPTANPEITPQETTGADAALPDAIARAVQVAAPTSAPGVTPTATLLPGVIWHTVQPDETMLSIAVTYGANAEILSQLNPEVPFLQCDFEFDSGGPRCIVQLGIGQQIRVPAPTPTATLSPTTSGSETPTPSATPTFNAPSALSPGDRALFRANELVTLRWVTTGTLSDDAVYRIVVRDLTIGQSYQADTRDLFFIVPEAWQGRDQRRHEYQWTVSVFSGQDALSSAPSLTTQARLFIWESQPGS